MNLWVASPPIVWPMMMALGFEDTSKWAEHGDAQMQRAIDAAVAAGFQLESTPAGRERLLLLYQRLLPPWKT
jgi:hypothetical protein